MKENTNEVKETEPTKAETLAEKGDAVVKEVCPKVKNFFKKVLPVAAGAAGGVILGVLLAGKSGSMSDAEFDDAGIDLGSQDPEN